MNLSLEETYVNGLRMLEALHKRVGHVQTLEAVRKARIVVENSYNSWFIHVLGTSLETLGDVIQQGDTDSLVLWMNSFALMFPEMNLKIPEKHTNPPLESAT
ncbi:MAG: hypothetical protein ABIH21_00305 [Patescibacteria group bacterium]